MRKNVDHVNHVGEPGAAAADELFEAMHDVLHRVRAQVLQPPAAARGAAEPVLTPLEGRVLGFFARHPGATQSELAAHSGRDKGQLARLVNGLRERGLLLARPDEADRRVVRLQLAPAAQAQHQALQRRRRRLAELAVADLDAGERGQLLALLQRIRARLDALP